MDRFAHVLPFGSVHPFLPPMMRSRSLDASMAVFGAATLAIVLTLTWALAADVADALTRNTIRLALAWYAAALGLMIWLRAADWRADTSRGALARWCWTWAVVTFWIHLGMAFHYFHHWSHAHAFEHTREESGFGEGIFVSYLFTALWTADAIAWWLWPVRYAERPAAIDRCLHAFMLFIVFNGTVVYESGPIRYASAGVFSALALLWLRARTPSPSGRGPG